MRPNWNDNNGDEKGGDGDVEDADGRSVLNDGHDDDYETDGDDAGDARTGGVSCWYGTAAWYMQLFFLGILGCTNGAS